MPAERSFKKESIYSLIIQNRRHLELIKQIRSDQKTNLLSKALFKKHFHENYRSLVVLSNSKTVLNVKFAKREVKERGIRADPLAEYIRRIDADPKANTISERDMEEFAYFFLSVHKPCEVDYTAKFKANIKETQKPNCQQPQPEFKPTEGEIKILCSKCDAGAPGWQAVHGCSMLQALSRQQEIHEYEALEGHP